MSHKPRDIETIFQGARRISDPTERAAYLATACGVDRELRGRIESLLAAGTTPHSTSNLDATLEVPSGSSSRLSVPAKSSSQSGFVPASEQPGTVIGRYQLIEKVGEGGFGIVFMAEQREPVQRIVALKIIKLGMDTRDVIARFEQERQALAVMDHPNIARVLDAGATETGRPYFVMEFVQGVAITDYCDKQNMPFRERLTLFIQVCGAIQHAHQKGIIHRDIKPSNVLVAEIDGKPVPKVIDFGIAKATQQKLIEHTMFTGLGQFMGTPAYMSPEQAEPLGLDVDTRSDIYSLGVLLYELLTGATPFEMKTLRAAALDEVKRIIREKDPPKPSTRLSTLGDELPSVAKLRGVEPRKLGSALRGELDWIVMKALEKDRTRRYESATEFARDVERYLNQEPVAAGPPSVSYRLHKFVRRNRSAVAAAAIALFALIGFAATMAVQAKRIAAERDRANHERELSDRVVEFQANMLRHIRPRNLGESIAQDMRSRMQTTMAANGDSEEQRQAALASMDASFNRINLTDTARTVLDSNILTPAAATIDKQFMSQPEVRARLQHVLGRTYMVLGMPEKGLSYAQQAMEARRKLLGEEHRDTLRSLNLYAMLLFDLDRNAESGDILRKTIAKFEKAFGPEDPDTLHARVCLAALDVDRTRTDKARQRYEDLIKTLERVVGPEHPDVGSALSNFGVSLLNQNLYTDAVPVLERALDIQIKYDGGDDDGSLFAMQTLAKAYQGAGRKDDAARLQLEAMERTQRARGARHPDSIHALANLADLYKDQGDFQKAEPLAKKSLELHRVAYGDTHRRTTKCITDVGIILGMLGRHAEAEAYHLEAYEKTKANLGPDHQDTLADLNNLAVHYWYLGQYQKALELFTEGLAGIERRFGKDHVATTEALSNLAIVYTKLGRLAESQAILEKTLAIRLKAYGANHQQTLQTRGSLAHLSFHKRDWPEADKLYTELVAAQKKVFGPEHPYALESTYNLALVKEKLERTDEAVKLLEESYRGRRRVVGPEHSETLDSATELARLRFEAGEVEEARTLFAETIAARRAAATVETASAAQLNACAELLLEVPLEDLRNPSEALAYSQKACAMTYDGDPAYLATQARALFRTGEKRRAAEVQRKAIALLPAESPSRAEFEERLAEYSGENPT